MYFTLRSHKCARREIMALQKAQVLPVATDHKLLRDRGKSTSLLILSDVDQEGEGIHSEVFLRPRKVETLQCDVTHILLGPTPPLCREQRRCADASRNQ